MPRSCPCCAIQIQEPYIRCIDCKPAVDLCPGCFAKGREFEQHKNDHSYEVRQNNFSIFEDTWSAAEETKLLDSLVDLGYGNWDEVAKQIQTKKSEECKQHYIDFYVEDHVPEMSSIMQTSSCDIPQVVRKELPFKTSDDPPRPMPMSEAYIELAGYMPCRGDFDVEFDNFAEASIKDIEFQDSDDELLTELKFSAVDIFYSRIKERDFRKRIVKKYGLINIAKDSTISYSKQERRIRESLKVFSRLQSAEQLESFTQGILFQVNLMKQIQMLQEYRRAGLKRRRDAVIYKRLCAERNEAKTKRTLLSEITCHIDMPMSCQLWLQKQLQSNANGKLTQTVSVFPLLARKPAAPLDLSGMPGQELLSDEEKEICSQYRIPPIQYSSHKNTLMKESQRLGSLKLQQARPLIKIDVNKTKRLYDFFIEKGWVNKDDE